MSALGFDRPKFIVGVCMLVISAAFSVYFFWTTHYGSAIAAAFFGGSIGAQFAVDARRRQRPQRVGRKFTTARVLCIIALLVAGVAIGYFLVAGGRGA